MNQHIKELIDKLNREQCTEEEIDFLLKYLHTGSQEELANEMATEWKNTGSDMISDFQKEEIWKKIAAARENQDRSRVQRIKRRRRPFYTFLKFAAVFIGLGLISVLVLKYRSNPTEEADAITVEFGEGAVESLEDHEASALEERGIVLEEDKLIYPAADTARGELVYHTIRIPHGRKFQVVLSDGSTVFLNSGTTFKYPVSFHTGKKRIVSLKGEAFFKVAKRTEETFQVQTGSLKTEVLGTEFNISSHGILKTEIVLVEGRIRVDGEESITLVPDEKLTVAKGSGDFLVEEVEAEEYIQWIYGVTWFRNESFEDIIPRLERQFDVEIKNEYKDLGDFKFTGRFETEGLKEILEVFKMVTDFQYEISGQKVIIQSPKNK